MNLPMPWVDKIFLKLTLTFGRDFLGRWEGIPVEDVKADWAHELRGLQQNPSAIAYGLQHCLSGKAPTVQEFKAVCARRPDATLALPIPPADPKRVAVEIAKLTQPRGVPAVDHKAWAKKLHERHKGGARLNRSQIFCYRSALGISEAACETE